MKTVDYFEELTRVSTLETLWKCGEKQSDYGVPQPEEDDPFAEEQDEIKDSPDPETIKAILDFLYSTERYPSKNVGNIYKN